MVPKNKHDTKQGLFCDRFIEHLPIFHDVKNRVERVPTVNNFLIEYFMKYMYLLIVGVCYLSTFLRFHV